MRIEESNVQCIYKIAAILAPSLGPCGMDKLLVDAKGDILVTNDGATILAHLPITHPANKLLAKMAQTQARNVGDGTTTTVLLASSLLQQATLLYQNGVHPTIIIQEYKNALDLCKQIIQDIAISIEGFEKDRILLNIANTSSNSKVLGRYNMFFAKLAVAAVKCLAIPDFHKVKIITHIGDTMTNSRLMPSGVQIRVRNRPSFYEISQLHAGGNILVTSADLNTGCYSRQVTGTSVASVHSHMNWASAELVHSRLISLSTTIIAARVLIAVFVAPISPIVERHLVEHGVLPIVVESIDELEAIAMCTDTIVIPDLDNHIKIGMFKQFLIHSDDVFDFISIVGVVNTMCTVVLVAPTDGLVAECERSFVDMLRAILTVEDEPRVVGGGGCVAIELSVQLQKLHGPTPLSTYTVLCRNAFCDGLMTIPHTLAINGGFDTVQLMQKCKKLHIFGHVWHAVDLESGQPANMLERGIVEPVAVFWEGLSHAVAMVELILRTDKNIVAKKRQELVKIM